MKIIDIFITALLAFFNINPTPVLNAQAFSTFASGLKNPRDMVWDSNQNLLVSIPALGRVVSIDSSGNISTVVQNLNKPHGLAFYDEFLYIAESHVVARYIYDAESRTAKNKRTITSLPNAGSHFTRSIFFLGDKLLISIGSDCNACNESDWRRAKILIDGPLGGEPNIYAQGLRNSVFMTLRPGTDELWATEMGQDFLGDNLPPDEINIINKGADYGWPYCYGQNIPSPLGSKEICDAKMPSHIDLPAHVAPLGLEFISPTELLVALHGSWNSKVPVGYKIIKINTETKKSEDFLITGIKRPVDIIKHPTKNEIYISDDSQGKIFKYEY